MITVGTSHFKSRNAARRYYEPYGYDAAAVDRKIADGEIHLGPPILKPGESLSLIDDGTRYAIKSEN